MIPIMVVAHFHYVIKYGAVFAFICGILYVMDVILDMIMMKPGRAPLLCNIYCVNITFFRCIY